MLRRLLIGGIAAALLVGGCSASEPRGASADDRPASTLDWKRCGEIECSTLSVPLDPDAPDGSQITLALGRHRATGDRIGTLLVNPGGPGVSARQLPVIAESLPGRLGDRFDVVSWDPRGVGESSALDCGADLDAFYAVDRSPDTPDEIADNVEAAQDLASRCERADTLGLLAHMRTADTVADLERIRIALGEAQISFLGWSYGTVIGAEYLQRHPDRLRALVLDAPVDVTAPAERATVVQAQAFDAALDEFFDWCAHSSDCNFGGSNPRSAFDRLAAMVEQERIPAETGGETRELGPGEFDIAVASTMYDGRAGFPELADALSDAAAGDASALMEFADGYTQRRPDGSYPNTTDAFYAVSCTDTPAFRTLRVARRTAARAASVAPYTGAASVWLSLPCTYWPVAAPSAPVLDLARQPDGPPVLVVSATGDPATPLAWGRSVARSLGREARLVVRDGGGHGSFAHGNDCIDAIVSDYLTALDLPPSGTQCADAER